MFYSFAISNLIVFLRIEGQEMAHVWKKEMESVIVYKKKCQNPEKIIFKL